MPKKKERKPPSIGSTFRRKYKGTEYEMSVVKTEWGTGYKVAGTVYKTPTAAAMSISQSSMNGYLFWGIEKMQRKRQA